MAVSDVLVQQVWEKGVVVNGQDSSVWRKDKCEAWINRQSYGSRDSQYGWEVDHIDPDGLDMLFNLSPLQWKNNLAKSDGNLRCVVTSSGVNNVDV